MEQGRPSRLLITGAGHLAAALAAVGNLQLVPTVFSSLHGRARSMRRLGPGGPRAPFNTPEDADRHARRVERWWKSPRTDKRAGPPSHLRD